MFVTKYRQKVLTRDGLELIEKLFREVANTMGFSVLEFNGEEDHIHLLIQYPPKLSIAGIVNSLKGVSSRKYGLANLQKPKNRKSLWAPSYFTSSVGGASLETLKSYIQNQQKPS